MGSGTFGTPARAQRIAVAAMVAAAASAAFVGVAEVDRHQELIRLSYELSSVSRETREAEEENRRLHLERSLRSAPERIERLATELGMVRPKPEQMRRLPTASTEARRE